MICPNCGEENPDRARFCLACATPLTGTPAPSSEERKVVSVLFVDLVGFTAGSDRADPEDVRATLRPYHAMLKREIERFGGTVEKFIGDAVMAAFGAPVAHEDDAERAVRSALRIIEAIPELNSDYGLELAVRAAVDTGEAVVALGARPAEGEGFVTGDVVNTASRLQGVAPVGGAVVGETTYRSTGHVIDYEPLDPVTVKGKAEPIPIWRVIAARGRFGVDVERPRTPFVGRDDDLALLHQTFARTLREGSVQLVTITGEPGVGKTRVVAEFHAFVDDRPELVYWRQGRCLPYGDGVTFWALGEIVKALAGILESDGPEDASRKLEEAVALVVDEKDRDWVRPRMAPLVGLTDLAGSAQREESFAAWRTYLESVAATAPLVMVVEDLHWADEAMFEFLEHLVDWATGVPMLVVGTARPELYERNPGWGGGKRNSSTIALSPLPGEDTARLIAALLDQAVLPTETQELLLERAGGNPLYAEEFVRMLVDRGVLTRRGNTWVVDQAADIPVPETVHALIAARLDTLTPDRKALLHDASVVGKVFWSGAIASMGPRDDASVRDGLHELARKELVRASRRSSVEDQAEYAFWHLLVRDVAYGQIPRAGRAAKHRAAGEWIEWMAGDRVADHAELLAHHYGRSLELSRAAGRGAGSDLTERTARFVLMAADRAEFLDTSRARELYERALPLLEDGSVARVRAQIRLANMLFIEARFDDALQVAQEAATAARAAREARMAAEADILSTSILWQQGDTERSLDLISRTVAALEAEGEPSRELAMAYSRASASRMLAGDSQGAMEFGRKALPLTRQFALPVEEMRTLQFIGSARYDQGDLDGIEDLEAALRIGLETGHPFTPTAYINLGDLKWELEGPAAGLEMYRAAVEFAERRGISGGALWGIAESAWVLYDLGRWDEAIRAADEVLERDHERAQVSFVALPYKGLILALRGEAKHADAVTQGALPRAREIADPQIYLPALWARAVTLFQGGRRAEALEPIQEFEEATAGLPTWRPYYFLDLVRILVAEGRADDARRLVDGARARGTRQENVMRSVRAALAESAGDLEAATAAHLEAAAAWESYGFVLERGQSLLGAGRCLVGSGVPADARAPLAEARGVFASLPARSLLAEVDRLLEQATARSS